MTTSLSNLEQEIEKGVGERRDEILANAFVLAYERLTAPQPRVLYDLGFRGEIGEAFKTSSPEYISRRMLMLAEYKLEVAEYTKTKMDYHRAQRQYERGNYTDAWYPSKYDHQQHRAEKNRLKLRIKEEFPDVEILELNREVNASIQCGRYAALVSECSNVKRAYDAWTRFEAEKLAFSKTVSKLGDMATSEHFRSAREVLKEAGFEFVGNPPRTRDQAQLASEISQELGMKTGASVVEHRIGW